MNRDFRDLFAALNAAGVEYLLVGAHALAVHGHIRATKDIDVWVRPSPDNAVLLLRALGSFGAPTEQVSVEDFSSPGLTYQIGLEPFRIDILTAVDGLDFGDAWSGRIESIYGEVTVSVLSRQDLIVNKRASGRTQDLADVEALERGGGD